MSYLRVGDPNPAPLDIPGAILSISSVTILVFSIIEAPVRGWADAFVIGGFVVGLVLLAGFIYREIVTDHPMLNISYFRNPRFSGGAGAISIGFFAMFGMVFGLTQYLQFVQGYTPLEAGLRLVPVAAGIVIGAGNSHRLVGKLGTNRVVAMGLILASGAFVTITLWEPATSYWIVGATLLVLAFGLGNVMAPATDAVMGAVREENAGVASAMNDVTRQVAGAFGVAVIGSAINTAYGSRMSEAVADLPPEAASAAKDSVGAASKISSALPAEIGAPLAEAASVAFTDALGIAVLVSAAAALTGSIFIVKFMPARHLPIDGGAATERSEPLDLRDAAAERTE